MQQVEGCFTNLDYTPTGSESRKEEKLAPEPRNTLTDTDGVCALIKLNPDGSIPSAEEQWHIHPHTHPDTAGLGVNNEEQDIREHIRLIRIATARLQASSHQGLMHNPLGCNHVWDILLAARDIWGTMHKGTTHRPNACLKEEMEKAMNGEGVDDSN